MLANNPSNAHSASFLPSRFVVILLLPCFPFPFCDIIEALNSLAELCVVESLVELGEVQSEAPLRGIDRRGHLDGDCVRRSMLKLGLGLAGRIG